MSRAAWSASPCVSCTLEARSLSFRLFTHLWSSLRRYTVRSLSLIVKPPCVFFPSLVKSALDERPPEHHKSGAAASGRFSRLTYLLLPSSLLHSSHSGLSPVP